MKAGQDSQGTIKENRKGVTDVVGWKTGQDSQGVIKTNRKGVDEA